MEIEQEYSLDLKNKEETDPPKIEKNVTKIAKIDFRKQKIPKKKEKVGEEITTNKISKSKKPCRKDSTKKTNSDKDDISSRKRKYFQAFDTNKSAQDFNKKRMRVPANDNTKNNSCHTKDSKETLLKLDETKQIAYHTRNSESMSSEKITNSLSTHLSTNSISIGKVSRNGGTNTTLFRTNLASRMVKVKKSKKKPSDKKLVHSNSMLDKISKKIVKNNTETVFKEINEIREKIREVSSHKKDDENSDLLENKDVQKDNNDTLQLLKVPENDKDVPSNKKLLSFIER